MSPKVLTFIGGILLGAIITFVVTSDGGSDGAKSGESTLSRLTAENTELRQERDALSAKLEEERIAHLGALSAAAAAPEAVVRAEPMIEDIPEKVTPPDANAAPTEEEIIEAMKKFGGSLQGVILGQGDETVAELRAFFERVDAKDLAELIERYGTEGDMQKKIVIAHALAQSGRPEAIEALRNIVLDRNRAFTDRRFVAHGLAFVNDPALQPLLLDIGRNDPDRGTRANAAFGLARAGVEEGVSMYASATDEAFEENDPAAMQYLSGFYLLGEKALPQVRERLTSYKDPQTRVVLIELVKKEKDRESLPALHRLAGDPASGQAVQEAAKQAIEIIEADEGE